MIEKTESEIINKWVKIDKPLVSICTITYNHEEFIEEALDSFLMQETSFPFEIIIDDDCSTDETATIIKKYQEKYPNIIKAWLRKKNVGACKNGLENLKRAKGQYIALCEGDDYWIDCYKLQKQIDIFSGNSDVTLCFHPAYEVDYISGESKLICQHRDKNTKIDLKDIIIGRGGYIPTASIVYRNIQQDKLFRFLDTNPPLGDYFLQVYMASLGRVYYINEAMAVYRRNVTGSWTASHQMKKNRIKYNQKMIVSLDLFSQFIQNGREILYEVMIYYAKNNIFLNNGYLKKYYNLFIVTKNLQNHNRIVFFMRVVKQTIIGK